MTAKPQPEPCKHCRQLIDRDGDWFHVDSGLHRCELEPYGYHAEPVGTPCRAGGPNPCVGARDKY